MPPGEWIGPLKGKNTLVIFTLFATEVLAELPVGSPLCSTECLRIQITGAIGSSPGATTFAEYCQTPDFVAAYNNCLADNCVRSHYFDNSINRLLFEKHNC
jgi:hypothetical protein